MRKFSTTILAMVILLTPANLYAAMSSTDYYIYADTIDTGGVLSTGGEYSVQSSLGESPVGTSTGGVYEMRGGYQAMERGDLSLVISSASLNLGDLVETTVNSSSTTATVSTDAPTGYVLSIGSVSGTAPTSVSDGSVTAGTEEYGMSVTGTESNIAGDVAVTARVLASSTVAISNSATTLTFKATISSATVAGTSYSQTVNLSASANF